MTWHVRMSRRRIRAGFLCAVVACPILWAPVDAPLLAQEKEEAGSDSLPPDSIRRELARLRGRGDSLHVLLEQLRDTTPAAPAEEPETDPGARLRAAALATMAGGTEASGAEEPREQVFQGRQRALQALNPEISVGGDVVALGRTEGPAGENFLLREVEFAFQASLDPFSRAKIIASHHSHGGVMEVFPQPEHGSEDHQEHASGLAVEEAYAQWVGLPGGFLLTVGRFRQRLGTYNRWHRHALPWGSLPLAYQVLLGDEGLCQTGASLYWLAPVRGPGTYEVWLEGTRSSNPILFGQSGELGLLGHVNAFFELSPSTYLELSVSGLGGDHQWEQGESGRRLLHLEAGVNWRPPGRELYREVTVRGALLRSRGPVVAGDEAFGTRSADGGFLFTEVRVGRSWLAGLRYDRIEDPEDPDTHAWGLSPTLTWWQSEFVRARAEYDWLDAPGGCRGQIMVQLTFAMGPHKHESY